jgi:hypothetical protein
MRCKWMIAALVVIAVLSIPSCATAQNEIPSGTILPVSLDTGLNAAKLHPGQQIRATVMQDIPGTSIRHRAKVLGHVVRAEVTQNGKMKLELQFDSVKFRGRSVPLKADLRALASFLEVEDAQVPEEMASRGMTPVNWTTQQIGGDQFYRGGPVTSGMVKVGKTTPWGALDVPRTQPGMPCRGAIGENRGPQAMWLFSSDACGVYGFGNIRIEHAGRTKPAGTIILVSTRGKLKLGSGTAILLRASSPATATASNAQPQSGHPSNLPNEKGQLIK